MARFNFCAGTYQSISPILDAELAMNLYPETAASPNARSAVALIGTDGLSVFASLPAGANESVPGGFTFAGRTFTVGVLTVGSQIHLYELMANGNLVDRTPGGLGAALTSAPAVWAANPNQVAFTVAGTGYIYVITLATNVVTAVQPNGENAAAVAYIDGFGVCFIQGTNTIMISNLEDFTTWPAINIGGVSEFADPIVSMKVISRTAWFQGQKATVPYYDSGALFPLVAIPGAYIEEGSGAAYGSEKLDNTLFWISGNPDEGGAIAYRMNGYTPQRISNHDVETAWQSYATIADVISSRFQSRGHKFWQLYFPTANATWRYDVATKQWHRVGTWNPQTGTYQAHKTQWFTFNFGKMLCGDPTSGNIYVISPTNLTDAGTNIRRERIAPYIAKEHENVFHKRLELLCETGDVTAIPGPSENPVMIFLEDSTGVVWSVQVTDAGGIVTAPAPAGSIPSTPILADSVNQSTFWLIMITPGGFVEGSPVNYGRADIAQLPMATNGQFQDSGLQVNQGGIVSAIAPLPHLRPPQLQMCFSDDGTRTWSNWRTESMGLTGDYRRRVMYRRLGKSRNRAYRVVCSDPVPLRIIDAYINDPKESVERLGDQMRKMA